MSAASDDQPADEPVLGRWQLVIGTPIGRLPVVLDIARRDAGLVGWATARDERVALDDLEAEPTADGVLLRWRQTVTRPMRLTLTFDVIVVGPTMQGESRAGRLPRSKVTGHRAPQ